MSTDMSQFYQVFFEEATELLAEKENLLLGLDLDAPDSEQLNAIFRAAHSIKGGASTFGFTDMTEVTHVLESLLDRIRKGEMKLTGLMVDAFLNAADVLKAQLAGHRGEAKPDPDVAAAVCATLKQLSGQGAVGERSAAPVPLPQTHASPASSKKNTFAIQFELQIEGTNVAVFDNLLTDLASRGALEIVRRPGGTAGGECALKLTTSVPEEDIWEALAFVVDPAALKIEIDADTSLNDRPPAVEGVNI